MELKYWSIQVCSHCVWCVHVQRFILRMSQSCTGQPTAQGTEGDACFGRPFYLTCLHGYINNHGITWSVNGSGIGTSDLVYVVRGDILVVTNITEDLFSNVVTSFKCAHQYRIDCPLGLFCDFLQERRKCIGQCVLPEC